MGEAMFNHGVGVIIRSDHQDFKAGDHIRAPPFCLFYSFLIYTYTELTYFILSVFQEYFVVKDGFEGFYKLPESSKMPWSLYLGVLGMPSATAYYSWKEFIKSPKGRTIFISSAAGAVGSIVVQLAKRDGMKVIASSGSDEKAQFARECGADVSFNYKSQSTEEILQKEGPIDM
jgi:NADPH-dependent curcumin reductase CurA